MNLRYYRWISRTVVAVLFYLMPMSSIAQDGLPQEVLELKEQTVKLYQAGRYADAILPTERMLVIVERVLGPEHPDVAGLLGNLAELYRATGAYTKAELLFQRALAIQEKVHGPEHPYTATLLSNFALLYQTTGAYAKAEPLYLRAIAINEKVHGPEHPDTAIVLHNLASLYRDTGAYAKAVPLYQRALTIYEKAHGPEHPNTATMLNSLAGLYRATGAYAKAEPLYKRVLAIREKARGPEHPDIATTLNNLAELYRATGAYAKAEPLYQRALTIYEKVHGHEHRDIATTLNNLAELYRDTGAYTKAEPLYQRALAIYEKVLGPEHPNTSTALNNLGLFYKATGAYAKAELLYQRALAIREKVLGPEHPQTAVTLCNLAGLYLVTGAYAKAEPLYQRALSIQEKVRDLEHPDIAYVLDDLALLYRTNGAYAKAEPLYQRALAIREKVLGPEHPQTAVTLCNLAGLYRVTGAYAKAESLYQRALVIREKVLGPEHPDTAASLNNFAMFYQTIGAYAKAVPLYQHALAIREKVLGPKHLDTASTLNNLASLYGTIGAYAKAEPLYLRALTIYENTHEPAHSYTASTLNNLAKLYQDIGAYAQAEPLYLRALAIKEKVHDPEHPDIADLLNNLGTLYLATGVYAKAEPLIERALEVGEINTVRFLFSGSEARKRSYLQQNVAVVDAYITFSLTTSIPGSKSLGLTSVLQYKGRALDAMSDNIARLRRSIAPTDRALFDQLTDVAQQYSTLTFGDLDKLTSDDYRQRLDELAREQERLQTELSSRSAVLREAITPVTLEAVRQALPPNTALVEWFHYRPFNPKREGNASWDDHRYVAYILQRSGEPAAIDLGPAQPIDDLVLAFRNALSDPNITYYDEVAKELSGKLIKPLLPHVAQSERLLLSPDGALNLLPFAALMDEQGTYLVRRFELTYLTSGRDLLRIANKSDTQGSPIVMADPAYGEIPDEGMVGDASLLPARSADLDRGGLVFKPLPGTALEAKALGSLLKLGAQNVITGDRATETKLKGLHRPRILHLATHGFFLSDGEAAKVLKPGGFGTEAPLGENPLLRSGLALAGANARHSGSTDDGILTALEAAQLDLLGTELVVLSACETGVGKVQNGDGVYGLRRALVLAGAQTQMVSLWKLADVATQELMLDYYQRLIKGEGRSGALRDAQKTMMANPEHQHPYYWAAFVSIGNWEALPDGQ